MKAMNSLRVALLRSASQVRGVEGERVGEITVSDRQQSSYLRNS